MKILEFSIPYLIATSLGVLLTFAFAPYHLFPLAFLIPAVLLYLWIKAKSLKQSFFLGLVFGLGFFGKGVSWIFISIHEFGGVNTPFALFITISLIAYLSLFPAVTGLILNRYFPNTTTEKLVYAFPAIWVLSEWFRGVLLTGFPWLFLGYSQTQSWLKGYAPILSVYLVSLMLTMSSGLLVNAIIRYQQNTRRVCVWNLFALASIWIIGGLLSYIPWTASQGKPVSVALVQGNIPQSVKWSPDHIQLSIDTYLKLTQPLWGRYKIIIWPESSIPLPLQDVESLINQLGQKGRESHSTLILGIPIQNNNQYYNTIVTLGEGGNQVYQKRHLVPFGEYIPFSSLLSNALNFMNIPMSEMIPGNFWQAPFEIDKIKILPSICYEVAYPTLMRHLDKNINFLLVVTNDAWFGKSNAEAQHLQIAAMRALEFGKPLLFVSNDGITAIINAQGHIQAAIPQRQAGVLPASAQPRFGITPWLKNGTTPLYFILFYFLFISIRANKRLRNPTYSENIINPTMTNTDTVEESYGRTISTPKN